MRKEYNKPQKARLARRPLPRTIRIHMENAK